MSLLGLGAYDSSSGDDSDSESDLKKPENANVSPNAILSPANLESDKPAEREILANPFLSSDRVSSVKPSFMQETEKISGAKFDNSVFQNPFRDKEDKKTAVLEQHVEMTQREQTGRTIDGKKVCWNFRKGRCRNGHKCKFAHDNDIKNAVTEKLYTETKKYEVGSQIVNEKAGKGAVAPLQLENNRDQSFGHISQAGQRLMENMGWEKGKGLGARQDGIVNAIQVSGYHTGGKRRGNQQEEVEEEQRVRKRRPGLCDSLTLGKKHVAFHNKVYK